MSKGLFFDTLVRPIKTLPFWRGHLFQWPGIIHCPPMINNGIVKTQMIYFVTFVRQLVHLNRLNRCSLRSKRHSPEDHFSWLSLRMDHCGQFDPCLVLVAAKYWNSYESYSEHLKKVSWVKFSPALSLSCKRSNGQRRIFTENNYLQSSFVRSAVFQVEYENEYKPSLLDCGLPNRAIYRGSNQDRKGFVEPARSYDSLTLWVLALVPLGMPFCAGNSQPIPVRTNRSRHYLFSLPIYYLI